MINEPGKSDTIELERPSPGAGEVLLQIHYVGLCGSDLNTFRGLNPLVSYPRVPGHELGATIEAIGVDVPRSISLGQQVLVIPYNNCGACTACKQDRANSCRNNQTLGIQRDGALAEYFVSPWQKLLTSEKLGLPELALVEPLTVGFHAVGRGRVTKHDTVAVLGCGAIGLGVIAGAAARDARVIAIDVDDVKLELAKKCGASVGINTSTAALHDRLQQLTDGHGPDVIVEAVGLPQTFRAAVEEICFAGRVVYIGYAKAPIEYETKLFVMKELDILGSRNALPQDFKNVITMLECGRFPTDDVVTTTVPLGEASAVLQQWSDNPSDFTKIHISFDS